MLRAGIPVSPLRARGIGRDPEDPRTLFVIFEREPSDDEMRAVHDLLAGGVGAEDEAAGERDFAPLDVYEAEAGSTKDYAAEAAMLCQKPAFKAFLEARHGLDRPLTDDRCAQKVRSLCRVTSRAAFNEPGPAAQAWVTLRKAFSAWRNGGQG